MPVTDAALNSTEVSFTADGLRYAGLEWGNPQGPVILALHGWLDNALSFSVLAPFLRDFRFIALELSGQGFSDHRSPDATYHIWDDIPQLLMIVDQLGVEQVSVIGHSRGAAIAALLASALGSQCVALVLLDGMLPVPVGELSAPEQFRQAQKDHLNLERYTPRRFPDVEAFVIARQKLGFSRASARTLAPRALRQCGDGLELVHDPRLNHASAIKLTSAMCESFYRDVTAPSLLFMAEEGLSTRLGAGSAENAAALMNHCVLESMPGGHHSHMEQGASAIGPRIAQFIGQQVERVG